MRKLYIIGSLRNPSVVTATNRLQECLDEADTFKWKVFSDWMAAGPEADDFWKAYEQARGRTFVQALKTEAAQNVFNFDKHYLLTSDVVLLLCPAGKSGHLELGWCLGKGKPGIIWLDDPDRWDVMYNFATEVIPSDASYADVAKVIVDQVNTSEKFKEGLRHG